MPDSEQGKRHAISERLRIDILRSVVADQDSADELEQVLAWLERFRARPTMRAEKVSLREVLGEPTSSSAVDEGSLQDSLVFVKTVLKEREVKAWNQPLMVSQSVNFCGLILVEHDRRYLALMQVVEEPGIIGSAQIGPTVQMGMSFVRQERFGEAYFPLFENPAPGSLLFSVAHSEEGGRFYMDEITYAAILSEDAPELRSDHYRWISVATLKQAILRANVLNIHARTLLCMLA